MKVVADNLYARVVEATRAERDVVWRYLSAPVPGHQRSQAFQQGRWDGMEHFMDGDRFPSGFLRPLAGVLRQQGHKLTVEDARRPLQGVGPIALMPSECTWLLPFQREAIAAFLPRTRGVIESPTGSGKSEILVAIAQLLDGPTLALVDTKDLLHNLADRFEKRAGGKAGRVGDGLWDVRRFTVATVQSIDLKDDRSRDLVERARVLLVDEVQTLPADESFKIAMATQNAFYRLGVSATPTGRLDGRDHRIVGALGPLIHRIQRAELVDAGLVSDGRVVFVGYAHTKATGSYGEVYEAQVVLNEGRNRLVVDLALRAPRPTLVFVKIEQHGRILLRMLEAAGARAEFVHGKTPSLGRRAAISRMVRGDIDVLICGKIFNKGVDIPALEGLVNAAGGKSAHDAIQRAGRGGRTSDGKVGFVYYDIDDQKSRWLQKHSLDRKAAYRLAGFSVEEKRASDVIADLPRA